MDAALAQTYSPLEILVCDDHSPDGTWDVIQDKVSAYRGPHTVVPHRHGANLGPKENLQFAVRRARGEYHVLAHGDDISVPSRVSRVVAALRRSRATLLSHNAVIGLDANRKPRTLCPPEPSGNVGWEQVIGEAYTKQMLGATYCWDPVIWNFFGPLDETVLWRGSDHVLPFRALLLKGMYYLAEPLIYWRLHPNQITEGTADVASSPLVKQETVEAYNLAGQLHCLNDLQRVLRTQAESPIFTRIEQATLMAIYARAQLWAAGRSGLEATEVALSWSQRRPAPHSRSDNAQDSERGLSELAAQEASLASEARRLLTAASTALGGASGLGSKPQAEGALRELVGAVAKWNRARTVLLSSGCRPTWRSPAT